MKNAGILVLAAMLVAAPLASAASPGEATDAVEDRLDLGWLFGWFGFSAPPENLPVFVTVPRAEDVLATADVPNEPRFMIFESKQDPPAARETSPEPAREEPRRARAPLAAPPDAAIVVEAVREAPGAATHPIIRALDAVAGLARDVGRLLGIVPAEEARDLEAASTPVAGVPVREAPGAAVGEAAALAGLAIVAVAGAAAAAKGSGASGLRRLIALLAFTRLGKEDVLGHAARDALYARVKARPGLSLHDLVTGSEVGRTAVQYHLDVLEREGLVVSKRAGRVRVYHAAGQRVDEAAAAILDHATTRTMAQVIAREPGVDQRGLAERLAISTSLAHWHLARLERMKVVAKVRDGRRVRYYPGEGFAALSHLVQ